MLLHFIESPVFSQQIDDLLTGEEQRELQLNLLEKPDRGDLIKGSGGMRKLRFAGSGRGKRGGIRIVYYLWHEGKTFMLLAYPKNKQANLTPAQLKVIKTLIDIYTNE